ncbi:MAG: hypothetical protein PHG84_00280 [Endomicrobiaceae bacterium]|jgi:hypothetical protein|nr:hypothetical protein [Endomicrobiaceae bacterium]MDD3052821.1 hypothetical protein [Endomicrobiaceae bacterium]MDD3921953.1 hypothetical protein [Endomicrobiaceae bacterium]
MQKNSHHLNKFYINKKGQVLPYFLVMAMILLLSWAMMLNIAKLLRDRMILQNSVDNVALSIGTLQARTLNLLGATNHLMATILSTASYPKIAMFPTFSTDRIGGSMIPGPFCDYKCSGCSGFTMTESYTGVLRMKKAINKIQKFQDTVINMYMINHFGIIKSIAAEYNTVVVIPSRFAKNLNSINITLTDPKVLLGIKRNNKGITYYKTINYCGDFKAKHYHLVNAKKYTQDKVSWYIQDKDFYDKKLIAVGTKLSTAKSNENYPLFANMVGIKYPTMYAVSAVGIYNTKGAMFPDKESDEIGLSYITAAVLSPMIIKQLKVFYDASEALSLIPVVGPILGGTVLISGGIYAAVAVDKIISEPNNKNTPIYQYNNAELGGWDAHFVPVVNKK